MRRLGVDAVIANGSPTPSALQNSRTVVILGLGLLVVVAFGLFVYFVIRQPPFSEQYAICYALLPSDREAGLSGSIDPVEGVTIDLRGEVGQPNVPTQQQVDAFQACVERLTPGVPVRISNLVSLPAEPIGQVANRWARETGGLQLALPSGNNRELSLVRIGPDRGTKAEVIGEWCAEVSACVECDPPTPTADTLQVILALQPDAPLIRKEMPGSGDRWPVPPIGADGKPVQEAWQDVDASGVRWFLECQS
jgi:hypothetical protein